MKNTRRLIALALVLMMCLALCACGGNNEAADNANTLVYASGDYTRINPAMDEHCEINVLLFNGLTTHDGDNQIVPCLAKDWTYDPDTFTYTFNLEQGVKWRMDEVHR